jgi:hypothetical protein
MNINVTKSLLACAIALISASIAAPAAMAADAKPVKAAKATKKPASKKAVKEDADGMPEGPDADIADTVITEFNCELGNKITIYTNENDEDHIALRWKKRIHRLTKVGTTTGARRFENPLFGLIWIGIPSKGMLLDSRLNRQLANECKNAAQANPVVAAPIAPVPDVTVIAPPIVPATLNPVLTEQGVVLPALAPPPPLRGSAARKPAAAAPKTPVAPVAPAAPAATAPATPAAAAPSAMAPALAAPMPGAPAPSLESGVDSVPAPATAPASTPAPAK